MTGAATGAWTDEGVSPGVDFREEGMSVLLPPAQDGKVLLLGGAKADSAGNLVSGSEPRAAEVLDATASPPAWTRIGDMTLPRINLNTVLLPDGKVLVLGGHDKHKFDPNSTPSNRAEIYDPVLNTWTPVATLNETRMYHSTALLLPDGRVLCAGGYDPNAGGDGNRKTLEFYEPPYVFAPDDSPAARPTIAGVSGTDGPADQISYGRQLVIETPNASEIRKVVLMRPGSITHHTDTEQRYVPLDFVRVPGTNRLRAAVVSDPSVAPPGYYMLWIVDADNRPCERARFVRLMRQQCYIITDRSTFSKDEVAPAPGPATVFEDSLYVVMDGFLPEELGITATTPAEPPPAAISPTVVFRRSDGSQVTEMAATAQQLLYEDPALPPGVRQRFTFKYAVSIAGTAPFFQADGTTPIEVQEITVQGSQGDYSCRGAVRLTHQPNPYMLDGETTWLSVDLRVFKIRQGDTLFGRTIGGDAAAAIDFIQGVLADFNAAPATGAARFGMISTDPEASQLDLLESRGGRRVFNFAVAQVRYRGRTLDATDVRVFFRLFTTAATGLDYRRETYPRETNPDGDPIPVLGLPGGEIATIPFFAQARVNPTLQSMTEQRDTTNRRTISATGGAETTAYFGCWLDFNQTAGRFPLYPGGLGPYTTGLRSIQELIRGRHQCLVAEVYFAPDPIPDGATPGNDDNLSQRNLAILESPNPGSPATRTVQYTFEVKPSPDRGVTTPATPVAVDAGRGLEPTGRRFEPQLLLGTGLDELMIRWGNLPRSTKVTLYMPGVGAEEILRLAALRIGPDRLERVDEDTVRCLVGDVTYVPLPGGRTANIPGLLTFELPAGIKRGQTFTVVVQQVAGATSAVLGTFEVAIRVSAASELRAEEERTLSVMRHIAGSIPAGDRWHPVFWRYVGQISDRVREFGGDPDRISPSPDGTGAEDRDEREHPVLSALHRLLPWLVAALLALCGFLLACYALYRRFRHAPKKRWRWPVH